VVAGDRVYTMDRQTVPEEAERVLCFDAKTGKPLWTHSYRAIYGDLPYGSGPRAAPTVHEGRVYTLGAVGHLHCLDAVSGKVLWSKDTEAELDAERPPWGFAASPVIWRNTVIVHIGARPTGSLVAFDRISGKEVWRGSDDPAGYCTPIVIHHSGHAQLICWTPENVLGLSPDTGEIYWSIPYKVTNGVSIATPIFHEGMVIVSGYWEGTKAIRLGEIPQEATLAWTENRYLRALMSQPLYRDGYAYLLDKYHGLICFKLQTGEKVWADGNRMTPKSRNPQATLIWTGDTDRALVLNAEGELILARLTPDGYQEQSRTRITGRTWAHPAYAGSSVYARSDEELVCVRLTGEDVGR
jgi:outer membrane protein assembly factor BamB